MCGLIRKCLGRNLLIGVVITDSFDNVIISCSLLSNRNLWGGSFLLLMSACPPTQLQRGRQYPARCVLVGSCYDDQMERSQLFDSPWYLLAMPSNHVGQPSDTHDFMRIFMTLLARQLRLLRYYWRWHSLHCNCNTSKPVTSWTFASEAGGKLEGLSYCCLLRQDKPWDYPQVTPQINENWLFLKFWRITWGLFGEIPLIMSFWFNI